MSPPMPTIVAATAADIVSTLPWPYGCSSSAGWAAMRTLISAAVAAARSVPLSTASEKTAMLSLRMAATSFSDEQS